MTSDEKVIIDYLKGSIDNLASKFDKFLEKQENINNKVEENTRDISDIKETKLCKIYETRPLICRVDEGYSLFEKELSKDEYYKENYAACMRLRKGMTPLS